MLDWLKEKRLTGIEQKWVLELLSEFVKEQESELENIKEAKQGNSFTISKADKYKMWLYEAVFLEEYRDMFIQRNDVMTRQELDARNSTVRRKTCWEVVSEKYNSPSWSV
eukprot:663807-Ditylum_brightwellii.AAC.1